MPTAFFAWELGTGFGHLAQMLPLAKGLASQGHRVFFAARHLPRAASLYADAGVRFLQAPIQLDSAKRIHRPYAFAHLLANVGFSNDETLFSLASAWRNLFKLTKPDLIVADHSPVALLAARGLGARIATIGSGFCCPPDTSPLPLIRPLPPDEPRDKLLTFERNLLQRTNWLLNLWKQPPLDRLGQLYGQADECFLTTFPKLDHYGQRDTARYYGPVNATGGAAPDWPQASGPRVFAYLRPCRALDAILQVLSDLALPSLIYCESATSEMRRRESSTLRFAKDRPDPALAARQCDLMILNASHGSTCDALLAGRPILQIPLHREQQLLAAATGGLGASLTLPRSEESPTNVRQAIERLLSEKSFTASARAFASTHSDFDPSAQRIHMIHRALDLIQTKRPVRLSA